MNNLKVKVVLILTLVGVVHAASASAQRKPPYSYAAQQRFVHKDLGKVYLGMPFRDFAKQIKVSDAEVDSRWNNLKIEIPLSKGVITSLEVNVEGSDRSKWPEWLSKVKVKRVGEGFEYEDEVEQIVVDKIPASAFVGAMTISFKPGFDLKAYAVRTFGKDGEAHKTGEHFFYDIQWRKKTRDGLEWLIRSFHEKDRRSLQLLGRIPGTEWGLDDVN